LNAIFETPGLLEGLNVHAGRLTYKAVAESLGLPWTDPHELQGLASTEVIANGWGRRRNPSPILKIR
jgi:hypothetical protein